MKHLHTYFFSSYKSESGHDYNIRGNLTTIPEKTPDTLYPDIDLIIFDLWITEEGNGFMNMPTHYSGYVADIHDNWYIGKIVNQRFTAFPSNHFLSWLKNIIVDAYTLVEQKNDLDDEYLENLP